MNKNVIVLHDFDGRPYYKALETNFNVKYLNTRPFRFILRDIIKKKKINSDTIASIKFFFSIPFIKNEVILLAMAPFNWRIILYRFLSKRNQIIYHTSWHDWENNYPFKYIKFIDSIMKPIWKNSLNSFHSCISVTNSAKQSLTRFSPNLNDIAEQVYHVVDANPSTDSEVMSKWANVYPRKFKVGYVGRLEESKGIKSFLSIYNSSTRKDLEFHVIGCGNYESTVKDISEKNNDFNYHGFIDDRNYIHNFYTDLNFLLVPSIRTPDWEELFGVVIIEAMNKGVVVICTDHVGPTEIVNDNVNGFILSESEYEVNAGIIIEKCINAPNFPIPKNAILRASEFHMKVISRRWSDIISG
jgi:glycosyltransferase involved in cell wall biosynthesis